MSAYERCAISDGLKEVRYRKDEPIIHQGDVGDTFYILMEGEAIASVAGALGESRRGPPRGGGGGSRASRDRKRRKRNTRKRAREIRRAVRPTAQVGAKKDRAEEMTRPEGD